MAISIVIPVYNAQKTIGPTIESILNQDYDKFELILVDDGSQDGSLEICRGFAEKDERIQVFHQENRGVTAARKLGVCNSKEEWLTFIDADDLLTKNALKKMLAFSTDVDVVSASAFFCDEKCENPKDPPIKREDVFLDGYAYAKKLILEKELWMPWGKLFRRKLFSQQIFELPAQIRDGEDLIMNLRLAMVADKIHCIPEKVYYYRAPTISHSMKMKTKLFQLFYTCSSVKRYKILCFLVVYKWFYRIIRKFVFNR